MSGLLDFFTKEAGQKRRAWLDEKDAELTGLLSYFAGPHASDAAGKAGGLLATMSDAADFQDYTDASRATMRDPNLGNLAALATAGTALMVPGVSARMAEGAVDFGQDLARFGREEEGALNYTRKNEYKGWHKAPGRHADNGSLDDLAKIYPDDVYSPNGALYYGHGGEPWESETLRAFAKARGNPDAMVKVYRAAPKGVTDINAGDWVTPNKRYAQMHGESWVDDGEYSLIEELVRAGDLFTDANSIHEFGWDPAARVAPRDVAAKYPGAKVDISGSPAQGYTINRIVVPEAERGQGIGSDIMRDILRAADDEGATVSLTPSGDFGGSVSRLKKFYKKFGFVENKGRNRDFAISEGMYRPASGKNQ